MELVLSPPSVVSLDEIRARLNVDPDEPQDRVIHAAREQAKVLLREQRPFIWNATNHTLYWDDDGTGSHAAIAIATFVGSVTVTASDLHFV